jgi:hypothetical protein
MTHTSAAREAVISSKTATVEKLRVAANDNSAIAKIPAKTSVKKQVREYEANVRYEHEDRLIEAMSVEQRVRYRKTGIVPGEFQGLADEIEADISEEVNLFLEELRNAA